MQNLERQMQGLRVGHVHDRIKRFMTPYYQKFGGRVNLMSLLGAGGLTPYQMPFLTPLIRGQQNMLCYKHLLGECPHGRGCKFAEGHVAKKDVPDGFADECVRVLTPAMAVAMRQMGAGDQRGGAGGPPLVGSMGQRSRR